MSVCFWWTQSVSKKPWMIVNPTFLDFSSWKKAFFHFFCAKLTFGARQTRANIFNCQVLILYVVKEGLSSLLMGHTSFLDQGRGIYISKSEKNAFSPIFWNHSGARPLRFCARCARGPQKILEGAISLYNSLLKGFVHILHLKKYIGIFRNAQKCTVHAIFSNFGKTWTNRFIYLKT